MTRSVRSLASVLGALVLLPLAGCNPDESATSDGSSADPLASLEHETGQTWTVRWHPDVHTPALLAGRTAPIAASPQDAERAGRAFLLKVHALYQMSSPDDELAAAGADTDELGMTHARFTQKKGKLPVWGGDLIVHFDSDGALVQVNGRYLPVGDLTLAATKNADEAAVAAVLDARAARPEVDAALFDSHAPQLLIYPLTPDQLKLAFRVEVEVRDLDQPMLLETFVDATDGAILHRSNLYQTLDGSGIGVFGDRKSLTVELKSGAYWLEDASRGGLKTYSAAGRARLPGGEVKSTSPVHWDETGDAPGAAVDAHANVAKAWDYYAKVHGRAGWDGKGTGPHATVHFGNQYANAFFNGKQLVFGDGDGFDFSPLSAALDVVAHEYTHGVTAFTARLAHEGQSGALNEAISDIFGCYIAYGSGNGSDWQMGETIYHPSGQGRPLRDVQRPHATGNPATMAEYNDTPGDQGGVHLNSTIVSHAAYLMTEGDGRVAPLGVTAAQKIWYRALTRYLTSRATFRDAADATLRAAHDLGGGEASVRARGSRWAC